MVDITYKHPGEQDAASPSIWADCVGEELIASGNGFYLHDDFRGIETDDLTSLNGWLAAGDDIDLDPTDITGYTGRGLMISSGATDNNLTSVYSQALGKIVKNSGNKLWFECLMAPDVAAGDEAIAVGLGEAAAAAEAIADNGAAINTETFVGFFSAALDATVDVVYRESANTVVTVAEDVTNSGNLPTASQADIVADTPRKYGLRFDGEHTIYYYVDGYEVGRTDLNDATTNPDPPDATTLHAILQIKTGENAASAFHVIWCRYAYEENSPEVFD